MNVDVFIVTYKKDHDWLRLSLKVLFRNLTGFRRMVIVSQDNEDIEWVRGIAAECGYDSDLITTMSGFVSNMPGYYAQQAIKLSADTFTNAEWILHVDSDFFFKEKCDVSDFFKDGKPGWLWGYYSALGDTVPWQKPTEKAMGEPVEREYMMAMPIIAHRTLYPLVRERLEERNAAAWKEYLIEQPNAGAKFSEFNCMGHIAYTQQHDKYHWIDRFSDEWLPGHHRTRQYWSKAPIADHMPEIMKMLGEEVPEGFPIHCTEMGWWVIDHDTHFTPWVTQSKRLDHDQYFLGKVLPYIKPGMTVVDVGANIGTHTHAYAKATAGVDSGRVIAFEPNPLPFECLRRNMLGHGHVQCINEGLGASAGEFGMRMSDNVGASYMIPGSGFKVRALDDHALTRCDYIKVDVEGMEMAFLIGAARTIAQFRPVLVMEINPGALGRNGVVPEDIYSFLRLRGYEINGHVEGADQWDAICLPK